MSMMFKNTFITKDKRNLNMLVIFVCVFFPRIANKNKMTTKFRFHLLILLLIIYECAKYALSSFFQ